MPTLKKPEIVTQSINSALSLGPSPSAGNTHWDILSSVLIAIDELNYNQLDDCNTIGNRSLLINAASRYTILMARAYNLTEVCRLIAPNHLAGLLDFISSANARELTSHVSSADDNLQRIFACINPYNLTVDTIVNDTTGPKAPITPAVRKPGSIRNLRTMARARRAHVVSAVIDEMDADGQHKFASGREGAGVAHPIHPATGQYLHEHPMGHVRDINDWLIMRSPLYLFHARAWARLLYANQLVGENRTHCPWRNLTVEQLEQGRQANRNNPPSIENGGWWYLIEAERFVNLSSTTNEKLVSGKIVLPYYDPIYAEPLPENASQEVCAQLLKSVIIRKVGIDGNFGAERDYRSDLRKANATCTSIPMLKKIINHDKARFHFDLQSTVAEQMGVIEDINLDALRQFEQLSGVPTSSREELAASLEAMVATTSYITTPITEPTPSTPYVELTAEQESDLCIGAAVTEEAGQTNVVPFVELTPIQEKIARIHELRAIMMEAERLKAELEQNNPNSP